MLHMARVGRVADVAQRFGLVSMVGALLALYWGLLAVFFSVQHTRLIDQATRDLRLVNTAVAHHAAALFRHVETDLRIVDLWLRAHPDTDPLADPSFDGLVTEMSRAARGLIELRLVDRDGRLYPLPGLAGRSATLVADRDYFRAHLDPDAPRQLFIGAPVESRLTKEWSIPLSWRLEGGSGRFLVVTAAVRLDRLLEIHDHLRYKPDGTIGLVRRDGVMLSRAPFDARLMGRDVRQLQRFSDDVTTGNGTFTSKGLMTDNVPRMGTYERLDDVPVTVVVSRGTADVLEAYVFRRNAVLATSFMLTLGVIAFTAFLHRSQRALRHAQVELQRLATIDDLTGTQNRRAFTLLAEREFLRARRFARPLTVLALDIDHFKNVNDRLGHAVGDRVLKACCVRWGRLLREQDELGRLGGEEFCVLLTETPASEAAVVAERLRAAVSSGALTDGARVTVSIGLASVEPGDEIWADTLERADRALYAAKHAGRNRVVQADSPTP